MHAGPYGSPYPPAQGGAAPYPPQAGAPPAAAPYPGQGAPPAASPYPSPYPQQGGAPAAAAAPYPNQQQQPYGTSTWRNRARNSSIRFASDTYQAAHLHAQLPTACRCSTSRRQATLPWCSRWPAIPRCSTNARRTRTIPRADAATAAAAGPADAPPYGRHAWSTNAPTAARRCAHGR
jgi:hypothetical protein